jgi:hypothetical protein
MAGELMRDIAGVRQRPSEPVELRHDQRVAGTARRERLAKPGTIALGAGQALVDVDAIRGDTERVERVALGGEVPARRSRSARSRSASQSSA